MNFKKSLIAMALATATVATAVPATSFARGHDRGWHRGDRHYDHGRYSDRRGYRGDYRCRKSGGTTGLLLGCAADVLLNLRYVFEKKGQLVFLVGILVFLSGHVLYLAAILSGASYWLPCVLLGVVLTALLMWWIFQRITAKKAFKIFGVVYLGAIMLLNCVAIGNLIADPRAFTALFAAGSALFLVSDIVLILNTFGKETRQSLRVTNISLYYLGQLLIALSLLFLK